MCAAGPSTTSWHLVILGLAEGENLLEWAQHCPGVSLPEKGIYR